MKGCVLISALAESILSEPRGFVMTQGPDPSRQIIHLIPKQVEFEIFAFGVQEVMNVTFTPKDMIDWFEERRDPQDMTPTRMPLTVVLKGAIITGFMAHQTGDVGGGLRQLRTAMGLLEEGKKLWADKDPQDRGTMFNSTFVRATRVLLTRELVAAPPTPSPVDHRLVVARSP